LNLNELAFVCQCSGGSSAHCFLAIFPWVEKDLVWQVRR